MKDYDSKIFLSDSPLDKANAEREKLIVRSNIAKLEQEWAELSQSSSSSSAISTENSETRKVTYSPSQLRQILIDRFNMEELRNICFDFEVDYESLPGEGKAGKARELISYMQRNRRLPDLINRMREERGDL